MNEGREDVYTLSDTTLFARFIPSFIFPPFLHSFIFLAAGQSAVSLFMHNEPVVIARHLTLIDNELFQAVNSREFVSPQSEQPQLTRMIDWSTKLSNFISAR